MAIQVTCPRCNATCVLEEFSHGSRVQCEQCQYSFTVKIAVDETASRSAKLPPASRTAAQQVGQGTLASPPPGSPPPGDSTAESCRLTKIGPYLVQKRLGGGTMGEVWLAHDPELQRDLAVKTLLPEYVKNPERLKRFLREARAAAKLNHANTVTVFQVGSDGDLVYIAMELVEGGSLDRAVTPDHRMTWQEATRSIRDAAAGLAAAHEIGLVHRDVKPANLVRTRKGITKVVDFGLARALAADSALTQMGTVLGTPAYMAPELWLGQEADVRSDLYSLICTYFYLLTANDPFVASDLGGMGYQHRFEPFRDPRQWAPELPNQVCRVLVRGSQKDPDQRYQTAEELIGDLDLLLAASDSPPCNVPWTELAGVPGHGSEVPAYLANQASWKPTARPQPGAAPRRRRSRLPVALAMLVLAAAAAVAGIVFWLPREDGRQDQPPAIADNTTVARVEEKPSLDSTGPATHDNQDASPIKKPAAEKPALEKPAVEKDVAAKPDEPKPDVTKPTIEPPATTIADVRPDVRPDESMTVMNKAKPPEEDPQAVQRRRIDKLLETCRGLADNGEYVALGEQVEGLLQLDPRLAEAYELRGRSRLELREIEKALEDFTRAVDLDPNRATALAFRAWAAVEAEQFDKALQDCDRALAMPGACDWAGVIQGMALLERHRREPSQKILTQTLPAIHTDCAFGWYLQGLALACLGNLGQESAREKAIESLDKAIAVAPHWPGLWRARAELYREQRAYDKAEADYTQAMALVPNDATLLAWRGSVRSDRGHGREADEDFLEAVRRLTGQAKDGPSLRALGLSYRMLASRKPEEGPKSIEAYGQAIERRSDDSQAYLGCGQAYAAQHEYALAVKRGYDRALELDPEWALAYRLRGEAYHAQHDERKAIDDFTQAIRHQPRDAGHYIRRAAAYGALRDREHKEQDLHDALAQIAPRGPWDYVVRAEAANSLGEYDRAVREAAKAIDGDASFAAAYRVRGLAQANSRNYELAIADYTKAIELNPRDIGAHNLRGQSYSHQKDYKRAIADFTQAVKLDPKFAFAYRNRGLAYGNEKDYDRAIAEYTTALEIDPKFAIVYSDRGNTYQAKKDYDRAIADYNAAIEADPRLPGVYINRGNAYHAKKDYERAIADYELASRLDPKLPAPYNNLGNVYSEKHDYDGAVVSYTKALEADPRYVLGYMNRARAYRAKRDYDRALVDCDEAIRLDPQPRYQSLRDAILKERDMAKSPPIAGKEESPSGEKPDETSKPPASGRKGSVKPGPIKPLPGSKGTVKPGRVTPVN